MTLELYTPTVIDFQNFDTSWLVTHKIAAPPTEPPFSGALTLMRLIFKRLARRGISCALWYEEDRYPKDEQNPVPTLPVQFGLQTEANLLQAGLTWMLSRDVDTTPLTLQDLRFHFRFGLAQGPILATTFFQAYMEDLHGPQSEEWLDNLKVMHSGGSKTAGGVITAAGVDSRVKVVRMAGNQGLDAKQFGASPRHVSDWQECPPTSQHRNATFVQWAYAHRFDNPSYYDSYIPGMRVENYSHLLITDLIGSHDFFSPIGSHTEFFREFDGLDQNGDIDNSECRMDYRLVRRPNIGHGKKYVIAKAGNCLEVGVTDVLLWRTIKHVVEFADLPRMEMSRINTSQPTWTARVRVNGAHPIEREEYKIHVAMSDDRDFRRCGPEILGDGPCLDGLWGDDNKTEEDIFYTIIPTTVTLDGEFRDLTFTPPTELQAFSSPPLIAMFVELFIEGNNPSQRGDDLWITTDAFFSNEELYPLETCP